MNAVAVPQPAPAWSRRRWMVTTGVICAIQLVLIFLLSQRPVASVAKPAPAGSFRLAIGPGEASRLGELPWLADAAEFALASAHGFSGPLWRHLPELAPRTLEWDEPPRWLTHAEAGWPEFAGSASFASPATVPMAEPPAAAPYAPLAQPAAPAYPSRLLIEGGLHGRELAGKLDLPTWANADELQASTVEVLVNRNGAVLAATLLTSSGLEAADQSALQLARTAKFVPVDPAAGGARLTWGRLIFFWQTRPPGAAPPAQPAKP
jgi:TonB family protein